MCCTTQCEPLVLMMITPFAPRTPQIAVCEGSLSASMDSMSCGLSQLNVPPTPSTGTQTTTMSGACPEKNEVAPCMRTVMPPFGARDTITPAIRPASICSSVLEFSRAGASDRTVEADGVGSGGGGGGGGFGAGSVRLAPECAHPTTSVAMRAMDHFMGTSQARRCKHVGERAREARLGRALDSLAARPFHRRASCRGSLPPTLRAYCPAGRTPILTPCRSLRVPTRRLSTPHSPPACASTGGRD